jgi:hypothetical protein
MARNDLAFRNLSIRDLLDAREAFHIHLMKKKNVVGTAIGKYRRRLKAGNDAKRIDNTQVTESSWPCVLVFVRNWLRSDYFKNTGSYEDYIPSAVYLPDGREVPLCVIEAPAAQVDAEKVDDEELIFPSDFIGGGFPLLIESQGVERVASIGGIVSNGNKYYAVTNRHVTGEPGTIIYTRVKGTAVPIGKSSGKFLGNVPFNQLYNGLPGSNLVTNVDVGLIEIDDIRFWKTDIFQLGPLGEVFDLNTVNLSLHLIGEPIKAFGAVGGLLEGEVTALFYRFKSIGGIEYVSDFLIGPRKGASTVPTREGDSGTFWIRETKDEEGNTVNQPIAVQWGQHRFFENDKTLNHNFALATCLSNVLRELEVDVVADWNAETGYTWGEVGHYTIANFATQMVTHPKLKQLLANNLELITFQPGDLQTDGAIKRKRRSLDYTPLADVPDLVWKIVNGKFQRHLENPNHFADMDKPNSDNKTLLELCKGKGENMEFLTPEDWLRYYTDKAVKDSSKGILPFRVWQIYLQMVDYVSKGNVAGFIAAAGILAHYVGDACQPLHISFMFNGIPSGGKGEGKKGKGVHEAFEAKMINNHNKQILTAVNGLIKTAKFKTLQQIGSGKQAAAATVDLMKSTFNTIQPKIIVDAFIKDGKDFADKFWDSKGKQIIPGLFASGAQTLASLWNSAWTFEGNGDKIKNIGPIDPEEIVNLYQDDQFLPSVNIHGISPFLN